MNIPDPPAADDDRDLFERLAENHDVHVSDRNQRRPLGRGGFATVYKGTLGSGPRSRPCAVKAWHQSARPDDPAIRREVDALGDLLSGDIGRLPNVVTLLKEPIWEHDHANELILVTVWELADKTLQDLVRSQHPAGLSREHVIHFLDDVARGLDDLADLGRAHRDVKPANVLIFGSRAKLGDFGLARLLGASTMLTSGVRGTLEFMPPEALVGDTPEVSPTFDAYSFGVMYGYLRRSQTIFGDGVASSTLLNLHLVQRLAQHKLNGTMDLDGLDDDEAAFVRALCAPNAADRPREKLSDLFARLKAGTFGQKSSRSPVRETAGEADGPLSADNSTGADDPLSQESNDDKHDDQPEDNAIDVIAALTAWQAACSAVRDVSAAFGELEAELLGEQRKRQQLLKDFQEKSKTVRQQDAQIAEVTGRLEQQQRLVNQKLHERDATDADVCRAFDAQITALDREVHRLTDPDNGVGYRRESAPVQAVLKQIDELKLRQQPHLAGRDRHDAKQPRIKVREFLDEPANRIRRRTSAFGVELLEIPPGEFLCGSLDGEGSDDEHPQRLIRITQPFWIGKYPVTVGQVLGWLNDRQVEFQNEWINLENDDCPVRRDGRKFVLNTGSRFGKSPDQPMVLISWDGSMAYCEWATQQEPAFNYSLLTEAQWEYACRAGATTRYHWGDDQEDADQYAWYEENSDGSTHPVGQKLPNAWGIHDMHHVWQWCLDGYDENYYQVSAAEDPAGPSTASDRVLRGGCWWYGLGDEGLRSADRGWFSPGSRYDYLGFRLAGSSVGAEPS